MRFNVSSTALLARLQSISKVIASKNSLPILDNFLFNLEGDKLTITASDAEIRLETSIEVMNASGSGLFAVSAKILLDPLKELPEQPLMFDINDNNLEIFIHFQNGKYNFIGMQGTTYPLEKALKESAVKIEQGDTLSGALSAYPIFPASLLRMVVAGEQGGMIDSMLEKIADYMDEELENSLSSMTSLIEPILIVFLGIMIGGMVLAMFLPVFDLVNHIR